MTCRSGWSSSRRISGVRSSEASSITTTWRRLHRHREQSLDAVADGHLLVQRGHQEHPGEELVGVAVGIGSVRRGAAAAHEQGDRPQVDADDHDQCEPEQHLDCRRATPRRATAVRAGSLRSVLADRLQLGGIEVGAERGCGKVEPRGPGDLGTAVSRPERGRRLAAEQHMLERAHDPVGGLAVTVGI